MSHQIHREPSDKDVLDVNQMEGDREKTTPTLDDIPSDVARELQGGELTYTKEEHDKVLRKIDWVLMPISAWACGLQYVDKTALGAAATYGLRDDLKFKASEYSWAVSIFYFGYLLGSPLATRVMQRYHAGKTIGVAFFLWGITLLGLTWANGFAVVAAMRFLLGVFEAALAPGLLLITTMYYNQREQPARFGAWTLLNGLLPIPFLVIYFGLGKVDSGPLTSWRLIFLLVGLVSILTGILIYFILPDSPATAWFLNERERAIAVDRVAKAQTGTKNTTWKYSQFKEALTDYRVWLIVMQMFTSQAVGAVQSNFLGIIIKGLGFTALRAQLLTAPNFAMQFITCLWVCFPPTYIKRFRNMKQPLVATAVLGALAGCVVLRVSDATPSTQSARLAGVILLSMNGASYTQVMAVVGCNVAGFTKKQTVTAMTFVAYCVIAIVTPQTFLTSEAPRYPTGLGFCLAFCILFIVVTWASWFAQQYENKRRDKLALTDPNYATGEGNTDLTSGYRDLTDRENLHFRYSG